MPLKTTPWDSADYLRTEEERASYLAAALEEASGDAAFITNALGTVARSRNMSQLARDTGLTREGLYKALAPDGNPSFGTVLKVMHALGVQLTVSAKPKRKPSARKQAKPAAKRKATATARRQGE
jgi:probable addiction module antidote protein